ncbi:hypothetical protein Pmani_014384 [Petrolisthes manimaculis]|uniref:BED-type domain-containing protein n=1 Tax=Petrolisthes manimaculis TaxID=1843537 RepID=A0AAE1UB06_9EUCA|nr:hypothetical protein Pmani_014384 [Petrolisthes manimaculis]
MPRGRTGRVCESSGRRLPPPLLAPAPPTPPPPPPTTTRVSSTTTTTTTTASVVPPPHPVPRGRSRGSPVWLYFRFETEDRRRTMCSLCGHSMAWDPHTNSTSNMLKHIRNKHPMEHRQACQEGRHAMTTAFLHTYGHFCRASVNTDWSGSGCGCSGGV